jgi:hypothetical protein
LYDIYWLLVGTVWTVGVYECWCGCETWFIAVREEHKVREFENKVLKIIFGSKKAQATEGCGKQDKKGLRNLYSPPNISIS